MALNAPFIESEDGTKKKKSGEEVYEGSPLTIDANGDYALATDTDKVYGISKLDSNAFRDFSFGEFGAFGSGQLTAIRRGICVVDQSVFNKVEVDSSTSASSSPTTVKLYDDTKNYLPGEALYVDAAGLISNTATGAPGRASLMGKCTKPLAAGEAGGLEFELDPGATADSAELA
jgi:hypothetical protein